MHAWVKKQRVSCQFSEGRPSAMLDRCGTGECLIVAAAAVRDLIGRERQAEEQTCRIEQSFASLGVRES